MSKYANKRLHMRSGGGQFRKAAMQDIGIGGVCKECGHFLIHHYDGDPRDQFLDPRKFVYRCFHCRPLTAEEESLAKEIQDAQPKPVSIMDIFRQAGV